MPRELDAPSDETPSETPDDDDRVVVAVVRSGGIAGIRRRWQVEPPRPEARVWIALIERCPWDAPSDTDAGADRYVWSIRVRMAQEQRERELADSELQGAWRELVDAVRDAATPDDRAPRD
ncbi:protealysin inhibitor emfourin [Microbacterium abyssi]|uniref:protealysin inhibitor emfourin n=1 Tax=Microbacterium abyssi TaxID=2782166 RepID=UPI001888D4F3|nr:protealysin inhibitor emfourin [Microbacterium sp. A18JL241]